MTDDVIDGNAQYEFAADMGYIDPDTWARVGAACPGGMLWNATYGSSCSEALADVKDALYDLNWYSVLEPCHMQQGPAMDSASGRNGGHAHAHPAPGGTASHARGARMAWPWAVRFEPEAGAGPRPGAGAGAAAASASPREAVREAGRGRVARNWGALLGHVVPCADRRLALDWLNRPEVRDALHAAPLGTVPEWQPCSDYLLYRLDTVALAPTHERLLAAGLRGLVYSGDHDMIVPHTGTRRWVFGLPGHDKLHGQFGPWTIDGQIAGFVAHFRSGLTFATVKGAGHMVPQTNPATALELLDRFLAGTL